MQQELYIRIIGYEHENNQPKLKHYTNEKKPDLIVFHFPNRMW